MTYDFTKESDIQIIDDTRALVYDMTDDEFSEFCGDVQSLGIEVSGVSRDQLFNILQDMAF